VNPFVLCFVLVMSAFAFSLPAASVPEFSSPGGHYPHPMELLLSTTNSGGSVRFTLNGNSPSNNSATFTSPLTLVDRATQSNGISLIPGTATVNQHTDGWKPPKGLVPKATVVRAQVYETNSPAGPSVTHTYFAGRNPMKTYGVPVVSIALATNDLFNYNTGIYMLGRIFDDYVRTHPAEPLTGHTPANYTQRGPSWERSGHLEWFEPDGRRAFAQGVVVDIQGQSSRSFRQKSLGLKSIEDGFAPDDFRYHFFPGLTNRQGEVMTRFDHLRLANSGNDWAYTLMRDALCHLLVQSTRIDTLAYRPVVVYLDGEFWGVHNLREQQDPDYINDHYGVPQAEVVICQGPGSLMEGLPGDEKHYADLVKFIETKDMANATNYAVVGQLMDIENFIAYQAAEIYFANADWPHNNIRFWRRRTASYEPNAPYGHDGRWRWLLFDVDLGYAHVWTTGVSENSLALAKDPNGRLGIPNHWSTLIFRRLLLNTGFRNQFINTMADLLNSSFRETRASSVIQQMQATLTPAMADHIARWRTSNDSTNGWRTEVANLRFFASQRPVNVRQHLVSAFPLGGFANLTLDMEPRGAGELQLNTLRINESTEGNNPTNAFPWKGTYFRNVPVHLEALPRPGYRFAGWKGLPLLGSTQSWTFTLGGASNVVAQFERHLRAHELSSGPYLFQSWPRTAPAGSYPDRMLFEQTMQRDPGLDTPLTSEWTLGYAYGSRSRVQGLDALGVGFLNTSDPQAAAGAGFVGSAVLALDTRGVTNVVVSWVGGTIAPNEQTYALRLQYAVGDGLFSDVLDPTGAPVEYVRNEVAGHEQIMGPVRLPATANDQAYVRLRWKYHRVGSGKGPRALLRLDDVLVAAEGEAVPPRIVDLHPQADSRVELVFAATPRTRVGVEISVDLQRWSLTSETEVSDLAGAGRVLVSVPNAGAAAFFRLTVNR
jgi:hypothetical protein